MKYRVNAREDWGKLGGTSLKGYIETFYDDLVAVLGDPELGGDKTTAEWHIVFEDGLVASVYDYKTGCTPKDRHGWHIGGKTQDAVYRVAALMGAKIVDEPSDTPFSYIKAIGRDKGGPAMIQQDGR